MKWLASQRFGRPEDVAAVCQDTCLDELLPMSLNCGVSNFARTETTKKQLVDLKLAVGKSMLGCSAST